MKTLLGRQPKLLLWMAVNDPVFDAFWVRVADDLRVLESFEEHNGERWLHVSASYPDHLPTWGDMRDVKDTFIGVEREAYSVFPPSERYVNDHPYVLHLWCCLDGAVLPDFRRYGPRKGKKDGWTL